MIELYNGSIFDSKCDMIVIPCNNRGGISRSVFNDLLAHNLPAPLPCSGNCHISFQDNISDFASASVIAYAASVDATHTTPTQKLVLDIAQQILYYCHEHSLRKVNIPLLGTGAGGMTPKSSYDIFKRVFETDPIINLCVYAFSSLAYEELTALRKTATTGVIKSPRVFISYSSTNRDNRKWVKQFATRLRNDGVDARVDMFHLRPGQDLHQWMTNEVIMADKVLLICDRYYAEKADYRRSGVGWESMIILGDMLSTQEQTKYIGIIRDKSINESLPMYIRSKYSLNWSDDSQVEQDYKDLLLYLFDCDTEPPLGTIPNYIREAIQRK